MIVAWELYSESQGLASGAQCGQSGCPTKQPHVILAKAEGAMKRQSSRRKLTGFLCNCWQHAHLHHGRDEVPDMNFLFKAGVFAKGKRKNFVPQWGAESSFAGQWLPAAVGDGTWAVRTGSGPMRMCADIFAAARLWRGRLLTTGHLSPRHPVVVGAGDVSWGSRRRGGRKRGRAPGAALLSACGFSTV
jgi:hypothetical protein